MAHKFALGAKLWILLISALVLRLVLAFSTFHPDIRAFQLGGQLVASGNILNLYDYLSSCGANNPLVKVFGTDLFIYPPAIYLYHGVFHFFNSLIFGNFLMNSFLVENQESFSNIAFNFHLLLLKLPYLVFDLIGAVFIYKLFDEKKEKFWALTLWLFNPVNLYATYMMGQFDISAVSLSVLSLYYVKKGKLDLAALFLGLGAAFKIYPFFFLIPLILQEKRRIKRLRLLLLGGLPYLLTIIPFLPSHGFRSSALVAGLTMKSLNAQIPISGGESLLLFPMFLFFLYIYFYYIRGNIEYLWERFFMILLLFFIFTHYHPQWFLWLSPFLIIDLINSRFGSKLLVVLMLMSFIGLLFFFDPSLTASIFAPAFPWLWGSKSVFELVNLKLDYNFSRSILQTVFASAAVFYIFRFLTKSTVQKTDPVG